MRALKWIVGAALLVSGSAALAEESQWMLFDTINDAPNRSVVWLKETSDPTSLGKERWLYYFYESTNPDGEKSSLRLFVFNCSTRRLALKDWVSYASNGTIIDSKTDGSVDAFMTLVPDSVGEAAWRATCEPDKHEEEWYYLHARSALDNESRKELGYPTK